MKRHGDTRRRIAPSIQCLQPRTHGLRAHQVVVANRLANGSRPAMDHEPQSSVLVRLELDEMIATAQRLELDQALLLARRLDAHVAQRGLEDRNGMRDFGCCLVIRVLSSRSVSTHLSSSPHDRCPVRWGDVFAKGRGLDSDPASGSPDDVWGGECASNIHRRFVE